MELHTGFNTLDFIVLAIILLSGLFAIMTGFVREMYSLFNWVASYFVAVHFYHLAEPFVSRYISNHTTIVDVSIFVVFCASFIILAIIGMVLIRMLVRGEALSVIDHSLGFVFGLVRGLVIVCLIYLVASTVLWPDVDKPVATASLEDQASGTDTDKHEKKQGLSMSAPHWLLDARTRPLLAHGAAMLKEFVPEKAFEKTTDEVLKQKDAAEEKLHENFKAITR